jgi:hypothetical protein
MPQPAPVRCTASPREGRSVPRDVAEASNQIFMQRTAVPAGVAAAVADEDRRLILHHTRASLRHRHDLARSVTVTDGGKPGIGSSPDRLSSETARLR